MTILRATASHGSRKVQLKIMIQGRRNGYKRKARSRREGSCDQERESRKARPTEREGAIHKTGQAKHDPPKTTEGAGEQTLEEGAGHNKEYLKGATGKGRKARPQSRKARPAINYGRCDSRHGLIGSRDR